MNFYVSAYMQLLFTNIDMLLLFSLTFGYHFIINILLSVYLTEIIRLKIYCRTNTTCKIVVKILYIFIQSIEIFSIILFENHFHLFISFIYFIDVFISFIYYLYYFIYYSFIYYLYYSFISFIYFISFMYIFIQSIESFSIILYKNHFLLYKILNNIYLKIAMIK